MYKKLFLFKVFKQNKFLFFVFTSFTLLSFYFNYTTVETTPFFGWGMYSAKETVAKSHKIIVVKYNDGKMLQFPHTYEEPKSMMVYFTINYYKNILNNNRKDLLVNNLEQNLYPKYPFIKNFGPKLVCTEADVEAYLPWLKKYIESISDEPINNIDVYEYDVSYANTGRIVTNDSTLLYSIK